MINKLREVISKAKFVTLTLAEQGDQVQITATVRPKDGSDQVKPIQVKADWQIADYLLTEALNKPPKPGKAEVKKSGEPQNDEDDLFSANQEGENE